LRYPIAIIDYGIGGLGLYKLVRENFPAIPLLYFSDSGEVPYGKLPKARLRTRLEKVFAYLQRQGVERIIVACHSASSVVSESDKNVIGLRSQTVKAVVNVKPKLVGIIGGGRTIRSGYYRRELNELGIKTVQRVAQALSILVERGEVEGALVEETVKKIMRPLTGCDAVLLACTHYSVLSDVILKYVPKVIDPVDELYKSIHEELKKSGNVEGESVFLTTGNVELMKSAAHKAFNVKLKKVSHAVIPSRTAEKRPRFNV
jgi:glutamate racemase